MNAYNFGPASDEETTVFGAQRPGYPSRQVTAAQVVDWIDFMRTNDIRRVCCLLTNAQMSHYGDLPGLYREAFGAPRVCWAPIEDFHLCDTLTLHDIILPFLATADQRAEKTVVHCSAGSGRTGHVLAVWLVYRHGLTDDEALRAVTHVADVQRNPFEAVDREATREATHEALYALLRRARDWRSGIHRSNL